AKFYDVQRKMGYRFILRRLEYSKVVQPGTMMPIHMWWLNAGVAPVYVEYDLALEIRNEKTSVISRIPVDVRKWLPGDAVYDGALYMPENLADGEYEVRDATLDPLTGTPAIRFAREVRQADG